MTENVARDFAEKSAARAKDTYGKAQATAEETTKVMERSYSTASKGAADFNLNLLEMAQANMNAGLRLCSPTNARQIAHGISRAVDRARAQAIRNVQRTNTATHDPCPKSDNRRRSTIPGRAREDI